MALDYYERVKDRADNGGEPERMDEDTAYEMARQDRVDSACRQYEAAVRVEAMERRAAA